MNYSKAQPVFSQVPFNESNIKPLCLPGDTSNDHANKEAIVAGWGQIVQITGTVFIIHATSAMLKQIGVQNNSTKTISILNGALKIDHSEKEKVDLCPYLFKHH